MTQRGRGSEQEREMLVRAWLDGGLYREENVKASSTKEAIEKAKALMGDVAAISWEVEEDFI